MTVENYKEAMAGSRKLKKVALKSAKTENTEEELANIKAHWPFDDMDEEEYIESEHVRHLNSIQANK